METSVLMFCVFKKFRVFQSFSKLTFLGINLKYINFANKEKILYFIILETVSKLKPKNSSGKDNISTKLLKEIINCSDHPIAQDTSLAVINVQKLFPSLKRTKKISLIITDL